MQNRGVRFSRSLLGGALLLSILALQYGCPGSRESRGKTEHSARYERVSERALENEAEYPVRVVSGRRLGLLDQTFETPAGFQTAGVPCSTCHAEMVRGPMKQRPEQLTDFHRNMEFGHGEMTCGSCHAAQNRDRLKLADGRTIAFEETMQLCAQCHGPQMRDYEHGAHGGMSGHWDLSQGPRVRNHCVNCHDPHAPAYPKVQPAPPPRDRFLNYGKHESHSTESHGSTKEGAGHD